MGDDILDVLLRAAGAVADALAVNRRWDLTGLGDNQYFHDTVADAAALEVLDAAGFGIFSEESGLHHPERSVLVVIDPVDGSTNASRGVPWWAVSLCALDEKGPVCAVVSCPPASQSFHALRGQGAYLNDQRLQASGTTALGSSIIAFNGYPSHHYGWAQYRALGAAALDLCAVASGAVDGFVDVSPRGLAPWDYLGGTLVCQEAGATVLDADGRDIVLREPGERRSLVAAGTSELVDALMSERGPGTGAER